MASKNSPFRHVFIGLDHLTVGATAVIPIDGIYARLVVNFNNDATFDGIPDTNFHTTQNVSNLFPNNIGPIVVEWPIILGPNGLPVPYDQDLRVNIKGTDGALIRGFVFIIYDERVQGQDVERRRRV